MLVSSPYKGRWEQVQEDAFIYYGLLNSDADMRKVRRELSNLATYYRQDAIGLSVGEGELVMGYQVEGVTVNG